MVQLPLHNIIFLTYPIYHIKTKEEKRKEHQKQDVQFCMRLVFFLPVPSSTTNLLYPSFLYQECKIINVNSCKHHVFLDHNDCYIHQNLTCFVSSSAIVLPLLTTMLFSRDAERLPTTDPNPCFFRAAPSLILSKTPAYSMSAPKTNRTHTMTHASIAVSPK